MRFLSQEASVGVAIALLVAAPATAQQGVKQARSENPESDSVRVYVLEPLVVRSRIDDLTGTANSASVGFVGNHDLKLRPLVREAELLETVPGMILTQHSGGGKSNQMFVRGFNLDHGTDFSTRIEGIPVNLPTHAHGQGYTDLNFVIPELVEHIEYSLGNYYAEVGDFGSAGEANLRLRRTLERPLFSTGFGQDGFRRLVAAGSTGVGPLATLLAGGEIKAYDGPWDKPEDLFKRSGVLRYDRQGRTHGFTVLALAYQNSWQASDQIPLRGVESGLLGRFAQVDSTLGGKSSRYGLSGRWTRSSGRTSQRLSLYAVHYNLDLFSNFTYLLDDQVTGDQIRQEDDGRWTWGANFAHTQAIDRNAHAHRLTLGAQLRSDRADLTLSRTRRRAAVQQIRHDLVTQWSLGAFASLHSRWSSVFRTTLGLRADAYRFDVSSDLLDNTGVVADATVSPKVSLIFGPWAETEFYLSGGFGFHSNDARGVVTTVDPLTGARIDPVDPLVRSKGAEIGLRSTPLPGLRTTAAVWTVGLDSELLFVGDAGNTEASDPSRRIGVTLANFYRITPEWQADLDVSLTRGRFVGVGRRNDRIPGALESVIAAGVSREPQRDGVLAALRLRRFGSYPLSRDNAERAQANGVLNLVAGYRWRAARVTIAVLNLLDEEHSDIQYFYASRLSGEPAAGVEDLHFHPAEPRQIRLGVSWGL